MLTNERWSRSAALIFIISVLLGFGMFGRCCEAGGLSIVEMGILTVRCPTVELLRVSGTHANVGDYTCSVVVGETVELEVPAREGKLDFAGWFDESGRLLCEQTGYRFSFPGDTTVVASYQYNGPTTHYYVNDDIGEGEWGPGHDDNDGLSPSRSKRHIGSLLESGADLGWGAIIHVGAGFYSENLVLTADHTGLEIVGVDQNRAAIHGNQVGPCLTLGANIGEQYGAFRTGRISKLIFAKGTLGVLCNERSSPTISDCVFVFNRRTNTDGGAGLRCANASPTVVDCIFQNNHADFDGGGARLEDSDARFESCVFLHNSARLGGGMRIGGHSHVVVSDCIFEGNHTELHGGAMDVRSNDTVLERTQFIGNTSLRDGGALAVTEVASLAMDRCTFEGNESRISGGAIRSMASGLLMSHCLLVGNHSGRNGGAIYAFDAHEGSMVVANCTFHGNYAFWWGGAVDYEGAVDGVLENSILWGNVAGRQGHEISLRNRASLTLAYSCVGPVQDRFFLEDSVLDLQRGHMDCDPCFACPGYWDANRTLNDLGDDFWVGGDYHLQSKAGRWDPELMDWVKDTTQSPCIDAGDPSLEVGQEMEPHGGVINLGAYGGTNQASKSNTR